MPGPVHDFLCQDHLRLDALLRRSIADHGAVDREPYEEFRAGLLRHIAMEEKVLFPAARRSPDGRAQAVAAQLRADHAALAALLVPTPTHDIIETIRGILDEHNPLEEGPGGLYEICEQLVGADVDGVLARLRAVPAVRVAAHVDGPRAQESIARLLRARVNRER